jgi:hypothetical protein
MASQIELEKLKYPVGKFVKPDRITEPLTRGWITEIEILPGKLRKITGRLGETKLSWRYRPGGWSIRQVVHHLADSHMNSLIRFKLALTEEKPVIKPYFEDLWAELPDTTYSPIQESVKMLEGIHARWVVLLRSLVEEDLRRTFVHPEHGGEVSLGENLALYAWHSKHHLAHIGQALAYQGIR